MRIFTIILLAALIQGCSTLQKSTPPPEVNSAVKVIGENGTGSGTVLKSGPIASYILTNAHVCKALGSNGSILTKNGIRAKVSKVKISKSHDLCLVMVNRNLGLNTKIARTEGKTGEQALSVGHPGGMPQLESYGKFSGFMSIELMTGMKRCPKDPPSELLIVCLLYGYMPTYTLYESQVVSTLIQPGSSGSGIFNDNGELVNVAFAGRGNGLSYALTVPNGHVLQFLDREVKRLPWTVPAQTLPAPQGEMLFPTVRIK